MKKSVFFILLFVFFATGCFSEDYTSNTEDVFVISNEEKELFNSSVKDQLGIYLWNYSESENTYEQGYVVSQDDTHYEDILNASFDTGFDITGYEGSSAVVVSSKLLHFNNDSAGQAYFYFVNDNLVCQYYVSNSKIYSLKDRNVFLKDDPFSKYENTSVTGDFSELEINSEIYDYEDFYAPASTLAQIDGNSIKLYKYSKKGFNSFKTLTFENNYIPIDFAFFENGESAVLLGESAYAMMNSSVAVQSESADSFGSYYEDCASNGLIFSRKIVLLDKDFNIKPQEVTLDLTNYSCIETQNSDIIAGRGKSAVVFKNINGQYSKVNQYLLNHTISNLRIEDLDGNGTFEYVISENMDLYVYELSGSLELIWRTHFSLKTAHENIYIADLNHDGIKEIYSKGDMGVTEKYILTKTGFKTYADKSLYGKSHYILGDFNNDGKDDYICKINETDKNAIYISK